VRTDIKKAHARLPPYCDPRLANTSHTRHEIERSLEHPQGHLTRAHGKRHLGRVHGAAVSRSSTGSSYCFRNPPPYPGHIFKLPPPWALFWGGTEGSAHLIATARGAISASADPSPLAAALLRKLLLLQNNEKWAGFENLPGLHLTASAPMESHQRKICHVPPLIRLITDQKFCHVPPPVRTHSLLCSAASSGWVLLQTTSCCSGHLPRRLLGRPQSLGGCFQGRKLQSSCISR